MKTDSSAPPVQPPFGGLSGAAASQRLQQFGYNELAEKNRNPFL